MRFPDAMTENDRTENDRGPGLRPRAGWDQHRRMTDVRVPGREGFSR